MACAFLSMQFARHNAYQYVEEVQKLKEDNQRLLDYFEQGVNDPHREELRDRLMDQAWQLADHWYDLDHPLPPELADGSTLDQALIALTEAPNDDKLLNRAFELTAECRFMDKEDVKALHQSILDEQLPEYVRATLLGAMLLKLTQWFDARLVENLYIYTLDDQPIQLRAQAWVALVFVALLHKHRISHLPRLRGQYQLLAESDPQLLFFLQISLLQCREAFSFEKKLNDLVTPTDDENEMPSSEKLHEFVQMLADGTDMAISSFSQLKKMGFFSHTGTRHHWFEPFSLEQPHVRHILDHHPDGKIWTQLLMQSVVQCETDKYSAFLSMYAMDQGLMSKISQQLEAKGFKLDNVMPLHLSIVARNHLHDFYRYCNMHPLAETLRFKPFEADLLMCINPWTQAAFGRLEDLQKIAAYLFRKEHWGESARVYHEVVKQEMSEENLQRLIYACECAEIKSGLDSQAYFGMDYTQMMVQCNQLYPGNKWTEKRLADALDSMAEYVTEEQCLQEALTHHPDDVGLLVRMGHCLTMQRRAPEALSYLYKADIQKEGQLRVQRELARALSETGDLVNAERYIKMVLSRPDPSGKDWHLGALIAMQVGNVSAALERLKEEQLPDPFHLSSYPGRENLKRLGIDWTVATLVQEAYTRWYQALGDDEEETNYL